MIVWDPTPRAPGLNPDGTITLLHGTSAENVLSIRKVAERATREPSPSASRPATGSTRASSTDTSISSSREAEGISTGSISRSPRTSRPSTRSRRSSKTRSQRRTLSSTDGLRKIARAPSTGRTWTGRPHGFAMRPAGADPSFLLSRSPARSSASTPGRGR